MDFVIRLEKCSKNIEKSEWCGDKTYPRPRCQVVILMLSSGAGGYQPMTMIQGGILAQSEYV